MPCYDGRDEIEREYREDQAAKVEAVLCAVVTALGLELYHVNPAEYGVTSDLPANSCGISNYTWGALSGRSTCCSVMSTQSSPQSVV